MLQKIYCSQYILTAMQQHFFAKKRYLYLPHQNTKILLQTKNSVDKNGMLR